MLQESHKAQNRFMREKQGLEKRGSGAGGRGPGAGIGLRNAQWLVSLARSNPNHTPGAAGSAPAPGPRPPIPGPCLSGRLWVVLHQAEDVAFGVLAIGEPTYAWDRHLGDNALAAVGVHGL